MVEENGTHEVFRQMPAVRHARRDGGVIPAERLVFPVNQVLRRLEFQKRNILIIKRIRQHGQHEVLQQPAHEGDLHIRPQSPRHRPSEDRAPQRLVPEVVMIHQLRPQTECGAFDSG